MLKSFHLPSVAYGTKHSILNTHQLKHNGNHRSADLDDMINFADMIQFLIFTIAGDSVL